MSEQPAKALVIDDDTDFTEYVRMALEAEGFEAFAASDGEAGVEAARRERPEVILVDLLMAPKDGFDICEELRASPETRDSAILIVSGINRKLHKSFTSPEVGARLDVDGYLDKPVDREVLVKTVNDMLRLARRRMGAAEEEP